MRYAILYHLYNLKNVKKNNGGVLLLVKLQVSASSNTPPCVSFTFLKLYKWYQIVQRITYFYQKPPSQMFDRILNTPITYIIFLAKNELSDKMKNQNKTRGTLQVTILPLLIQLIPKKVFYLKESNFFYSLKYISEIQQTGSCYH